MDIKLKDVMKCIRIFQVVRLLNEDYSESFYPSYGELNNYSDYYVTDIKATGDTLVISIKSYI